MRIHLMVIFLSVFALSACGSLDSSDPLVSANEESVSHDKEFVSDNSVKKDDSILNDENVVKDTNEISDTDLIAEDKCGGCSGHGTCYKQNTIFVCACESGFTPSSDKGLDCVPTNSICKKGAVDYDVDGDRTKENEFSPSAQECKMYELINFIRASHNDEGSPECHTPLSYSVEWSAHARNHSKKQFDKNGLFHEDFPRGQNCAYGAGPEGEMDMYMNGANEGHCSPLSHHCNIMNCGFSGVGVGYWPPEDGTFNTQNFL